MKQQKETTLYPLNWKRKVLTFLTIGKVLGKFKLAACSSEGKLVQSLWKALLISSKADNGHSPIPSSSSSRNKLRESLALIYQEAHISLFSEL